ncbi:MAG: OmpA family protein [Alphaproteobacteria bacterium]|nr:OmpA family protein [Alphaproteobacteria bacterium]
MKFWVLISIVCLMVAGCTPNEPSKIQACEGSNVKHCSPVVYFLPDSYEITPYGKERLNWSIEKMKRWPEKKVLVTGHAYEWNGEEYNKDLAMQRAKAVGRYFVEQGIDPKRIRVLSRGNTKPVCLKQECQNLNRRAIVEIYNP